MILRRFRSDDDGTFGTLELDSHVFFTVEKPWKDNRPFDSCIPEGEYSLVPHQSKKYGHVLALINHDLHITHFPEPETERYAILIHAANFPKDVQGCIGLGDNYIQDKNMVTNSKQSIIDFYNMVSPQETHQLTIENADYLKGVSNE